MAARDLAVTRIAWNSAGFDTAKRLEYEIFGRSNHFTTPEDESAGEMLAYREWERNSEFYVGYAKGEPAAVVRYLRYDPHLGHDSFSTLRDFRRYRSAGGQVENYLFPEAQMRLDALDPRCIAELATQSVRPDLRGGGVIERVWREFVEVSRNEGVEVWTMALVLPLFRWYRAMLPGALQAIGRMIPDYVGADSIPAMLDLAHPIMIAAVAAYDAEPGRTLFSAGLTARRRVAQSVDDSDR